MAEYKGSIELISGITQKGGGDFPLVCAKDIQVNDDGTRLDAKLTEVDDKLKNPASSLPDVTTADDGKVLGVSDGVWKATTPAKELPGVTANDNGKVLGVSGGEWSAVTPDAGGVSSWNDLTGKPFGDNADGTVTQLDNKYLAILDHQAASQTDILPETSIAFVGGEGAPEAVAVLSDGVTYHVAWDEKVYVLTAKSVTFDGIAGIAIGNTAIIGVGDDTGEPFVLGYAPDYGINVFMTQAAEDATHKIRIYQSTEETYTVKEKNLPMDIIRRVVDDYINEALGGEF